MAGEQCIPSDPVKPDFDLSLTLPFFNEAPNVVPVLDNLLRSLGKAGLRFELIAVNNGSQDGTGDRIEEMIRKDQRITGISIQTNRGYGYGILTGLQKARARVVGYAWGDGQVKGDDLVRIYNELLASGAHLAKACRVERHDGLFRLVQTRIYFLFFALLFGRFCRDPNGCPKLFLKSALDQIAPQSPGWLLDPEIMIKAHRLGFKVQQVPVVFHKRTRGRSKVHPGTSIGFVAGLLRMRFQKPNGS
ncbi:MAG: glycosyltransferase family 2 protein [Planctomycetes bacterium]|nr:glycosyltransferase family 2 protein [Planctomycetota bacterium]